MLKQERWLIISLPFVAVILALAMKAVVRSIVVPVNRLADTCMRIVKQEDFTIEIEDYHKDEFSSLAQALNSLTERIRYLIYDVYEKKMELGKTQIQLLRSQMNPHLLYNTLETIRSKALLADQPELAEKSLLLADILRYGISAPGELVPVGEEVSKLQDYLRLQKHLYSDRFNEIIRMDPAVLRLKTIKFILQPLVENAIQHGFSHLKSPGYMEVLGYIDGEDLVFHVIDHGRGMSNEDLQKVIDYWNSSNSNDVQVGLRNVHKRLQLMFGESYGVTINSQINVGTSVYARLPCIVDEKGSE